MSKYLERTRELKWIGKQEGNSDTNRSWSASKDPQEPDRSGKELRPMPKSARKLRRVFEIWTNLLLLRLQKKKEQKKKKKKKHQLQLVWKTRI